MMRSNSRVERWSRRRLLRAVGAGGLVTVGLPWLEIFAGKGAWASCDSGLPRRFGTFLWGNGNLPTRWTPEGEGAEWTLSDQLQPLSALQHKISVLSGYSIKVDNISPHWSGAVGLLTGQALVGDDDSWDVAAPTIDQVIADVIGLETIFRSLEIGVESESCFSYTGPGAQNAGEDNPIAVYERIFGETFRAPGEEGLVDPRLGWRRSALDAVMTDISELESLLGAEDRLRLETHLDGLRQLETRLARLEEDPPDLESCARPGTPEESYPDIEGRPQMSVRSRVMADMLAMALACDQTRVFTFQFSRPLSPILYPEADDGHHSLTHNEADDQPTVHAITLQIMEEFAYLLGALDAVSEGEGTLLDNCAILAASEISEGKTHSLDEIPIVVAGGACGALNMGLHLRSYAQDNAGRIMVSLLRAMEVDVSTWGADETEVDDGISDLEGG